MKNTNELEIIGLPNSHDTLMRVFSDLDPKKVLDIPSGTGVFSKFLLDAGWDVHCADIDRGNLKLESVPFTQVNLNNRLPFDDASFEVIACINGLHRIYNLSGAIAEFNRILEPNGRLFINLNNYASIKSRIRFMFFGSVDAGLNAGHTQQTIDDPEANIRHCLLFPQLGNVLLKNNFEIISVQPAAKTWKHSLLSPFALVIRLIGKFISDSRRKGQFLDITASSGINPGGDYFLVEVRKKN